MTLFEDLKWRGLIKDIAGEESELQKVLDGTPFTFYWGTDPTADSLHIGHYSSLCMAKRLANAGHHPILLCGGATGRIGDPRPTAEREIISEETVNKNIKGIHKLHVRQRYYSSSFGNRNYFCRIFLHAFARLRLSSLVPRKKLYYASCRK